MALNRVILSNNSQNRPSFTKTGSYSGPGIGLANLSATTLTTETVSNVIPIDYKTIPLVTPIGSKPNVLSPNLSKVENRPKYQEGVDQVSKFSSKLLNYVEPYEIGGVRKTAFYSEISTNYKVGDRVFIINGNYDSHDKILSDKYSRGSDGYKILFIDGCKVVLDIDYTGITPFQSPLDIDDLIFVHHITSKEMFDYVSSFKTYVTDTTIPGELVPLFQGEVTSGTLRTWTGNIVFSGYWPNSEQGEPYPLDLAQGTIGTPTSPKGFYVRRYNALSNWINVDAQIQNNNIRLMDQISNPSGAVGNKKLYILGEDFVWNGVTFQERQIYKFDKLTNKWVVDRESKTAIITANYFKYGRFLGEHYGGLFGSYLKKNLWRGKKWTNGTVINSDWNQGFMESKTMIGEKIKRASLSRDSLGFPIIKQTVDTTNNSGFGYNSVIDSNVTAGRFNQVTFENSNIGSISAGNAVTSFTQKSSFSSNITVNSSRFIFSDLETVIMSGSTLIDSIVKNSSIKFSKSINSQIFDSVFDGGEYNSDSGIRILGAELNSWERTTVAYERGLWGVLKLFISDEDFFRMEKNDFFYIERVNKEFFIGGLDSDNRIILPYETKFLLNVYFDSEFAANVRSKQSVSIRDKRSNRNKFYISRSTVQQTVQKNAPRLTPINGTTYWSDVTTKFEGLNRSTPTFDPTWAPDQIGINGRWFYYTYDITQTDLSSLTNPLTIDPRTGRVITALPEVGFESPTSVELIDVGLIQPQTTHIFYYTTTSISSTQISLNGFDDPSGIVARVFEDSNGPFDPGSKGQFRGEWNISFDDPYGRIPGGGNNAYSANDVVRYFNPTTEKWEYYRCLVSHDPSTVPDSYYLRTHNVGLAAGGKILLGETSEFKNYCSIDIESQVFGWYMEFKNGRRTPIYPFDRTEVPPYLALKPDMNILMPYNQVNRIFKDVYIKNANFNSGIFINSRWVSGSLIEDCDQVINNKIDVITPYPMMYMYRSSSGQQNLFVQTLRQKTFFGFNIGQPELKNFNLNSKIWLNSIYYIRNEGSGNDVKVNLTGRYKYIQEIPGFHEIFPEEANINPINSFDDPLNQTLGSPPNPGTYSVPGMSSINHAMMHKVIIENSTIYSGVFRRAYFKNSKLTNRFPFTKPDDLNIDPSQLPKLVNILFADNFVEVENAFIFQSNITNIKNTGGYFYNCLWNGATFSNGEFQSGYWIDGTFEGGKFLDCKDFRYLETSGFFGNELISIYEKDDPRGNFGAGQLEVSTDRLKNPINYFDVGVFVQRKVWLNGRFTGGEFYNSAWINGTFSNGKFWRSDWYGGDFLNGIFGDPSIKYFETTFGAYAQYDLNRTGLISNFKYDYLGLSTSKWFNGEAQNALVGGDGIVYWYDGKMSSGEFTSASASINCQSIWYNGTFFGSIFKGLAQWKNGIFNSGKFHSIYGWEEQTGAFWFLDFPVYTWENGQFNGGEFGNGSTQSNALWQNGQFNGGVFQGKMWLNGVFSAGSFIGSGSTYSTGTPSSVNPLREQEYYNHFSPTDIELFLSTGNQIRGGYFGVWYNGIVTEKKFNFITNEKVSSKIRRSNDTRNRTPKVNFENIVWMDGIFAHDNGTIKNSLFTRGTFSRGTFDGGVFNPYIDRLFSGNPRQRKFQDTNIIWQNGLFLTGSFYASRWENGLFKNGYMSGAVWKNGIWEYGTADNIFWDGGLWRNGNWNGAPFDYTIVATGPNNPGQAGYSHSVARGRELNILLKTDQFMRTDYPTTYKTNTSGDSYLFTSNVFSASFTSSSFGIIPVLPMGFKVPNSDPPLLPADITTTVPQESTFTYSPRVVGTRPPSKPTGPAFFYPLFGWVTSSHFNSAINSPFAAKPLVEYYDAYDYVPVQTVANTIIQNEFKLTQKVRSDWGTSSVIPYYWDGTYDGSGRPNITSLSVATDVRTPVNVFTKFSDVSNLPIQIPSTTFQLQNNFRGYNTLPKNPLIGTIPQPDNVLMNGEVPNSAPSHKIYARWATTVSFSHTLFWTYWNADNNINFPFSTFREANNDAATRGQYTGFYFMTPTGRVYYFTEKLAVYQATDEDFANWLTTLSTPRITITYTVREESGGSDVGSLSRPTAAFDANGMLINYPAANATCIYLHTTIKEPLLWSNDYKISWQTNIRRGGGPVYVTGAPNSNINSYTYIPVTGGDPLPHVTGWQDSQPAGPGYPALPHGNNPRYGWQMLHQLGVYNLYRNWTANSYGADIYTSPLNPFTNNYDILQYYTELEVSVELEPEVSLEVWMAGASFSTFTLKSKEVTYANAPGQRDSKSYFPAFYRLKFNYITTADLINNPDEDKARFWVRKTSFGVLRIYSWRVYSRKVEYNSDFNNSLYLSTRQGTNARVLIPATPSVVTNIPTAGGIQNSITYGNGVFRQGLWENGVWNGGYRVNSSELGFFQGDDILRAFDITYAVRKTSKDTLWSIKLILLDPISTYPLNLDVGTKVSVSNLAAYDNTGRRIVISSVLEVESLSSDENSIIVTYKSITPISYIKRDSENHLIYVTSNVWKNGAFLNGVFRGVWNNGLFKGTPFLTKMFDSHFIDGTFEGGHFKSSEIKLGSSQYPRHNTGLIQNFNFKALNIATPNRTTKSYFVTDLRNSFQSWIDVVYSTQSKVNLKLDATQLRVKEFNPLMFEGQIADADYFSTDTNYVDPNATPPVSVNAAGYKKRISGTLINPYNHQGYPTVDVLSSNTELRDFTSYRLRRYRLGTKRNVYQNILLNDGNFPNPITSSPTFSRQLTLFGTTINIPQFANNLSGLGYTFSLLWQRVGADYIPPGYVSVPEQALHIVQAGYSNVTFYRGIVTTPNEPIGGQNFKMDIVQQQAFLVYEGDTVYFWMNNLGSYNQGAGNSTQWSSIRKLSNFPVIPQQYTDILGGSVTRLFPSNQYVPDLTQFHPSVQSIWSSPRPYFAGSYYQGTVWDTTGWAQNGAFMYFANPLRDRAPSSTFNARNAWGIIGIIPRPPVDYLKSLPANYYFDSNTDDFNDNLLRLTITDELKRGGVGYTATPLNWTMLLKNNMNWNGAIKPIPNRYYEFSVDMVYSFESDPTYSVPGPSDNYYQGLFLDDVYENMTQNDVTNGGLPPKNLHQYQNHFYTGQIERIPNEDFTKYNIRMTVKQTEYFMNKTNVDLVLYNNYPQRGGPRTIDIRNISVNEVDMLPFFSYFSASIWDTTQFYPGNPDKESGRAPFIPNQIDSSPRTPLVGKAPMIEFTNNNFSFTDNLVLTINPKLILDNNTEIIDEGNTQDNVESNSFAGGGVGGGVPLPGEGVPEAP